MAVQLQKGSGPAVDLTKLGESHVDLTKKARSAAVSLEKRGLTGIVAEVEVYLDFSGSMSPYYRSTAGKQGLFRSRAAQPSTVQVITDRLLGFGLNVDPNGRIPVYRYHNDLVRNSDGDYATMVDVSNYQGIVDRELARGRMGGTEFAPALRQVLANAKQTTVPMFVFFITDGVPADRAETMRLVCELADYPCFLKFAAVNDEGWPFLDQLNNLESYSSSYRRTVDNVNSVPLFDPAEMSDAEFIDAVIEEWDDWVKAASAAGILSD